MAGRARIARRLGGPAARRRRHRRFAVGAAIVALVAGVLLVAGGGDDGDGGADGAGPATSLPDDPVARVCVASNAEIGTAQAALLAGNDAPGAVAGFLGDAFVDLARARAEAIRALDPPAAPEVLDLLDDHDAVVGAIEADPEAAAAAPANPFEELNGRWRDLGLAECAIDSGTVPSP